MELHPNEPIQAKWLSPVAQQFDALIVYDRQIRAGFSPNDDLLRIRGSVIHLRCAITIEVQKAEFSLRLQRNHVAGARAEHIGVFKVKRKPLGDIWDMIVGTTMV
jgi:hypothetical protein